MGSRAGLTVEESRGQGNQEDTGRGRAGGKDENRRYIPSKCSASVLPACLSPRQLILAHLVDALKCVWC